ncbi:hypothetical protein T265_03734 [Opisthorchis viverrini]|uniref:Ankyrin repeat and MYND domain-containing protein 1 n=1 Tax=Opisthorchis viverrini TaxID=6198 RepID=A0A075AHE0_OPIVI|nr:hypothetical protein T265_03734 [Opisthorchis viverrini]KER29719.1 hypothetical protein T265_03734 [Opisthorchis viverrini]
MAVCISRQLLQQAKKNEAEFRADTVAYTDGFLYRGKVENGARTGYGVLCRNGYTLFQGYSKQAMKYGGGLQKWPQGDSYIGNFEEDKRNGFGSYKFSSGEVFEGTFYEDRRHGYGLNTWPDGSAYFGTFFLDEMYGYGLMRYADGSCYEGFIANDQPEGPGIRMSPPLPDGPGRVADIGYWRNGRLARLLRSTNPTEPFSWTKQFPEHAIYSTLNNGLRVSPAVVTKSIASVRSSMYKNLVVERYMAEPVFQRLLECNTQGLDRHLWQELLLDAIGKGIQDAKFDPDGCRSERPPFMQLSANKPPESELGIQSPVNQPGLTSSAAEPSIDDTLDKEFQKMRTINLRTIQAQVAKCRFLQNFVRSSLSDWLQNGNAVSNSAGASQMALLNWAELWELRFKQLQQEESASESDSAVANYGSHEQLAVEFLKNCQSGLVEPVRTQLRTDFTSQAGLRPTIDPNVAEHHGCFGLFYAVLAWNETLVNVLLDFGANVNQMTDEGVTALGLAFLFYSRAMQQLADQAGSQANHHLIRFDAPESESELHSEGETHDGSTFLHQAEVTIHLKDLAIVDDEKQRELAKLAQMHKLYAQKSPTKAATALKPITESQWVKDREQAATIEQPEMKLPSFERFTECLTRLNKQLDLRESARQRVQEMKDAVVQEESPHSKHPLIDWPTKEASAEAISAVARGLSRNRFFLSKQSLTPSTLSREGTMDTQTSSDSVGECQSAVNQKAFLLVQKNQIVRMIGLLLQRGADPNMAAQPIPSLFTAVRWADISMVRRLLRHGAQVNASLEVDREKCVEQSVCEFGCILIMSQVPDFTEESAQPQTSPVLSLDGLTPLHYAVLLPGKKGVRMVQMLLEAGANPDAQAAPDQSFTIQSSNHESESTVRVPTEVSPSEGGRTPLQLACAREYGHENAAAMVQAMMDHGANPNLTCNGHTALTLAIASGNDFAIDILLRYSRTNVNLKLTHGLGSALAVAATRMFEYRRDGQTRLKLLKKLVEVGGASTIMRFPMSWMSSLGNVVDATYNNYQEDLRLTKVPYHALHAVEKEVYTSRANIMEYLAGCLRESLHAAGDHARSVDLKKGERRSRSPAKGTCRHQGFIHVREDSKPADSTPTEQDDDFYPFCYGCGRSLGVRLTPCAKCKRVYYCSKACRMKRTQPPPRKKRPVSVKQKVIPPVENRPMRKLTPKAKTGKRQVLVCRSGGGEFLSFWHPAREFQFIINRYLRDITHYLKHQSANPNILLIELSTISKYPKRRQPTSNDEAEYRGPYAQRTYVRCQCLTFWVSELWVRSGGNIELAVLVRTCAPHVGDPLSQRAHFSEPCAEWKRLRDGQYMTRQRSTKTLTSKRSREGNCCLPGWGPRGSNYQRLMTLAEMAQSRS